MKSLEQDRVTLHKKLPNFLLSIFIAKLKQQAHESHNVNNNLLSVVRQVEHHLDVKYIATADIKELSGNLHKLLLQNIIQGVCKNQMCL